MSEQLPESSSPIEKIAELNREHPRAVKYARDLTLAEANVTALQLAGEIKSPKEAQDRINQVQGKIWDKVDAEEPGFVNHYIAARRMMVVDFHTDDLQGSVNKAIAFINELDQAIAPERAVPPSQWGDNVGSF